jgi:hypothetical protein
MPPPVAARSHFYCKRPHRQPPRKQAAAERFDIVAPFLHDATLFQSNPAAHLPRRGAAVTEQSSAGSPGLLQKNGRNCRRYHRNGPKQSKQNGCFSPGNASSEPKNQATIRVWRGCFSNQNIERKTWMYAHPWARE